MSETKFTRKHYHRSDRAIGVVHIETPHELRTAILLDQNNEVASYMDHQTITTSNGTNRICDFVVHYKNGETKIIEAKPKRRLTEFREQIEDKRTYASSQGWLFEVWTESELGFASDKELNEWANEHLDKRGELDENAARAERAAARTRKHYRSKIASDIVTIHCEFCKQDHTPLKATYDRNVARNGRYICEREGGSISGSKPKLGRRKDNPYAAEGKKQCSGECKQVLLFESFSPDNSKRDGLCSMCKACRTKKMKAAYELKKLNKK